MSFFEIFTETKKNPDINKLQACQDELLAIEEDIEHHEQEIKRLKNRKEELQSETMVDAMGDHENVALDNRKFVSYLDVKASIKQEKWHEILGFLDEINMSDVVSHTITVGEKGETGEKIVNALEARFEKLGTPYRRKIDIHYQTLQKMCRDLYAEGETIPEDLFSLSVRKKVKVLKKR